MTALVLDTLVICLAAALGLWALPWRKREVSESWSAFGALGRHGASSLKAMAQHPPLRTNPITMSPTLVRVGPVRASAPQASRAG